MILYSSWNRSSRFGLSYRLKFAFDKVGFSENPNQFYFLYTACTWKNWGRWFAMDCTSSSTFSWKSGQLSISLWDISMFLVACMIYLRTHVSVQVHTRMCILSLHIFAHWNPGVIVGKPRHFIDFELK